MLFAQEHYDLMTQFERDLKLTGMYAKKESKELWAKGFIYQHGETNNLFLAYRRGYAYGKVTHNIDATGMS